MKESLRRVSMPKLIIIIIIMIGKAAIFNHTLP
jgi:hypothetical protein